MEQLAAHGIERGWLLGESFGSQVAWAIVEQTEPTGEERGSPDPQHFRRTKGSAGQKTRVSEKGASRPANYFVPEGVILAGGFVRHCSATGVRLARECSRRVPFGLLKFLFGLYGRYVQFRCRDSPEAVASIKEFVARRTDEQDRIAMTHRYGLILQNDLRPVARRATLPVYCLCAMLDHLVPWPLVVPSLKRNCPGYRGSRIIFWATHNTLASAPKTSADQIVEWMQRERDRPGCISRRSAD
jgi:pimeloyl-ACP methyl ester carboxylesterase